MRLPGNPARGPAPDTGPPSRPASKTRPPMRTVTSGEFRPLLNAAGAGVTVLGPAEPSHSYSHADVHASGAGELGGAGAKLRILLG